MNDTATLTAQPKIITIDGKEYKIHPLTLADFGELQAWINEQFPDPMDIAYAEIAKGRFNITQQQFIIKTAQEQALRPKHRIGTVEATELMMSLDGSKRMLALSIRKGDPSFTDEMAGELIDKLTPQDIVRLQQATNVDMVVSNPKASSEPDGRPTKPPGSSMSRRHRRAQKARTGGRSGTSS